VSIVNTYCDHAVMKTCVFISSNHAKLHSTNSIFRYLYCDMTHVCMHHDEPSSVHLRQKRQSVLKRYRKHNLLPSSFSIVRARLERAQKKESSHQKRITIYNLRVFVVLCVFSGSSSWFSGSFPAISLTWRVSM
jgi:hypothetical protein